MPLGKLFNHIGKHHKSLLDNVTWRKSKLGKKPCVKIKKGAIGVFVSNFFDPRGAYNVMVRPHFQKDYEAPVHKLKKAKYTNVCLYAKKRKKCR